MQGHTQGSGPAVSRREQNRDSLCPTLPNGELEDRVRHPLPEVLVVGVVLAELHVVVDHASGMSRPLAEFIQEFLEGRFTVPGHPLRDRGQRLDSDRSVQRHHFAMLPADLCRDSNEGASLANGLAADASQRPSESCDLHAPSSPGILRSLARTAGTGDAGRAHGGPAPGCSADREVKGLSGVCRPAPAGKRASPRCDLSGSGKLATDAGNLCQT